MKNQIAAAAVLLIAPLALPAQPTHYDLEAVQYMDRFIGSQNAKDMLAQQGFVVTDQQFNQIFGAYISHDYSRPAPAKFITVDSAWHTYHVLLEESVKNLEETQAATLLTFSKQLYGKISAHIKQPDDVYADLARFAAVAMIMQDATAIDSLAPEEQTLVGNTVQKLTQGTGQTNVLFIGTPLSADGFRASSFYTGNELLRSYFSARQWYAHCNFRSKSRPETERAMVLALLIDGNPELKALHQQLTAPYTKFLGLTDDSGVQEYVALAKRIAGEQVDVNSLSLHLDELQKAATELPAPKVNDQVIPDRNAYQNWSNDTKGFRLFGPRRLASAVIFQNTIDPAIKGRSMPSGLDFFATGPLACEAGKRALQADEQIRPFAQDILNITPEPLPDCLHGEALTVLSLLQKPLPESAPQPLRTQAWADKQLWTELGAWAEQRHTWALHTKVSAFYAGMTEEPPGYVSPYPDFYRKLATLSRNTSEAFDLFETAELSPEQAGKKLLKTIPLMEKILIHQEEPSHDEYTDLDQFSEFITQYIELTETEELLTDDPATFLNELKTLGERWLAGQTDSNNDEQLIRLLQGPAGDTKALLLEFADLCESLAAIAEKELNNIALNETDARLIEEYGEKLARFHFYEGNSWLTPRDDFPLVTPIFTSPLRQETLYAGLPRPEALYIILDVNGQPVLHRGAVLSYREFLRPVSSPLADGQWHQEVWAGTVPPPPAFTASFRKAISQEEVLDILKSGGIYRDVDRIPGHEITQAIIDRMLNPAPDEKQNDWLREQLCIRAALEDVSSLIKLIQKQDLSDVGDIAICLANLPWKEHRDELMQLLHHKAIQLADSAAYIMSNSPEDIDAQALINHFDQQSPRTQRLYCYLLGHSKDRTATDLLIQTLHDKNAGLRYQAAEALGTAGIKTPKIVAALIDALNDSNDYVAMEAAKALYQLDAKEAAPAMIKWIAIAEQDGENERRYGGLRSSHSKGIFDNTCYSGIGSIMVLDEDRGFNPGTISLQKLKQWTENQ
jgi:hypothetical protein